MIKTNKTGEKLQHIYFLILLASVFALNSVDYAQSEPFEQKIQGPSFDADGNSIHRGFAGYIAVNAGQSSATDNNTTKSSVTSLKLMGSYVTDSMHSVYDAAYGVQNQLSPQEIANSNLISTAVMEFAARYQFENRWQFGVVYNQFFNQGDYYNSNQADAEFAGPQLLREFSFAGSYLGRIGGHIMTSLNLKKQSVHMAVIDFQIGWGGSNYGFTNIPDEITSNKKSLTD